MDAFSVAIETIFYQVFALGSKLLFTDAEAGRAGERLPEFEVTRRLEEGKMLRAPTDNFRRVGLGARYRDDIGLYLDVS